MSLSIGLFALEVRHGLAELSRLIETALAFALTIYGA